MTIMVEAIFENGVLRPLQPLPLKEHDRVSVTVAPHSNWAQETYGMLAWKGDHETLQQLLDDAEFDLLQGK